MRDFSYHASTAVYFGSLIVAETQKELRALMSYLIAP